MGTIGPISDLFAGGKFGGPTLPNGMPIMFDTQPQIGPDMNPGNAPTVVPPQGANATQQDGSSSSPFDISRIISMIPGILGVLNGFGIGGNGLTSALSGIPPQELALLGDEHNLLGGEMTNVNLRNQIVQDLMSKFGPAVNDINPGAAQPYIDKASGLIDQAAGYIPQASQFAQNADSMVQSASPIIQQALQYLSRTPGLINQGEQSAQSMTPDIAKLRGFYSQLMDLGSPFYQARQRQAAEANAQNMNSNAGLLRQNVAQSGMGLGPNGLVTAGLGNLAQGANQTFANSFLQNLFNNEQLQLQAATGMSQIPGMEAQQGGLFSNLANAATSLGSATGSVAQLPIQQGQAETAIAGIPIAQANATGNLASTAGGLGSIENAIQQLFLGKASLLNPTQALSNIPRMPSFPVNVNALPGISGLMPQKGGGGGGGSINIGFPGGGGGGMNIPGMPGSGTTDPFAGGMLNPIWGPGMSTGFGDNGPGVTGGPGTNGLIGNDPFGTGLGGNPFAGQPMPIDPGVLGGIFGQGGDTSGFASPSDWLGNFGGGGGGGGEPGGGEDWMSEF